MQLEGGKGFRFWEWIVIFGALAAGIAITARLSIRQGVSDIVIYTIVVFTVVLLALRQAWQSLTFWTSLLIAFCFHTIAAVIVLNIGRLRNQRFTGLPLIVVGVVEGLSIAAFVWKRVRFDGSRKE